MTNCLFYTSLLASKDDTQQCWCFRQAVDKFIEGCPEIQSLAVLVEGGTSETQAVIVSSSLLQIQHVASESESESEFTGLENSTSVPKTMYRHK